MAQNVKLLGATYNAVPAVDLPKAAGGTARFMDTSDADAVAADIASGKTAYVNGQKVIGTAAGGGGKNIQYNASVAKTTNKTSYTSTGVSITVAKTGRYKCSWMHYAYASSASYYLTRLYIGSTAAGSTHQSPAYNGSSGWVAEEASLDLTAEQTVTIYARTRSGSSYYTVAGMLVIEEI